MQTRQYRTPLKQLQALFWPTKETHQATIENNQFDKQEQVPMINKTTNH